MITQNEVIACIIFGIAALLLIALSVILMLGRGAWLMPAIPVGVVFKMNWLIAVYVAYMLISTIFVMAYCNTGNHFKK